VISSGSAANSWAVGGNLQTMPKILIETVAATIDEAIAGGLNGADRIELCAALPTGGVTPSIGMYQEARGRIGVPIVVMIRPREGGPVMSDADFRVALRDVRQFARAGADEIIFGTLNPNGTIDEGRNRELIDAAEGAPVVFHRVFDMVPDVRAGLDVLMKLGFRRVLTSGGSPNVDVGLATLEELVKQAAGDIEILPGGGVRKHNVAALVEVGCKQVHFSIRRKTDRPGYQGDADTEPDIEALREVREILDTL